MTATPFADQVRAIAEKVKERNTAIFRDAAQRVMHDASVPIAQGGRMPVDTGFLRNSARASMGGMPGDASGTVELVLLKAEVGETVYMGWTAAYALRMEYGFQGEDSLGRSYSQQGKGFARGAAENWQSIVNDATVEARQRYP